MTLFILPFKFIPKRFPLNCWKNLTSLLKISSRRNISLWKQDMYQNTTSYVLTNWIIFYFFFTTRLIFEFSKESENIDTKMFFWFAYKFSGGNSIISILCKFKIYKLCRKNKIFSGIVACIWIVSVKVKDPINLVG